MGAVLAIAIHFLVPEGGLVEHVLANSASDAMHRATRFLHSFAWYGGMFGPRNASGRLAPIVVLDIDDNTYRAWGEPFPTPRGKLAQAIEKAISGGAAAIVVDIDLSRPSQDAEGDRQLISTIVEEMKAAANANRPSRIILTQRLVRTLDGSASWLRPVFFADQIRGLRPAMGTATFVVDEDRIVRRWRLVESGCSDGAGYAAYSVQLVVAAVLQGEQAVSRIREGQLSLQRTACEAGAGARKPEADRLTLSPTFSIPLDDDSAVSRMRFQFDWGKGRYGEPLPLPGFKQFVLSMIPAHQILDAADDSLREAFVNTIVLIGATHYDSNDYHATPIGDMPGILLEANAINSLLDQGVMAQPPAVVLICLEMISIVLLATIFTLISIRFTFWVGVAVICIVFFPVALLLLKFGYWFNFATPILGPIAHQFVGRVEHRLLHV